MAYEHTFDTFRESAGQSPGTVTGGAQPDPVDHIASALRRLERTSIRFMNPEDTDRSLALLGRIRSVADSLMCDIADRQTALNSERDPAEVLRQGARIPTRESKRITKIAKQLSDMPKVKERFATGDITTSHVNALANAAEKVGPETVDNDETLLGAADRMLPDTFDRHTRDWSNRKLIEQGHDPLERQRRAREAKLWVEKDTGLGVVLAKIPRPQFEHLRQTIDRRYMVQLRRDTTTGDGDPDTVRTPKQRVADVIYELLTNRDSFTGEFIPHQGGVKAKASSQLVVTAPLGVIDGTQPDGEVEIIGVGPVPRRILETLTPDTELAGMIFDRKGRSLWLGRNQRLGNAAQRLAIAVRDGGCFECGAPMHRCELHHIQEWRRDNGPTDIDNLVAVCRPHHKWLKTNNLQVHRTPYGYQTRPRAGPSPP